VGLGCLEGSKAAECLGALIPSPDAALGDGERRSAPSLPFLLRGGAHHVEKALAGVDGDGLFAAFARVFDEFVGDFF